MQGTCTEMKYQNQKFQDSVDWTDLPHKVTK